MYEVTSDGMYKARLELYVDVCLVGCRMERALLGSVEAVALSGLERGKHRLSTCESGKCHHKILAWKIE
jgi:hypothetical protein